MAFFESGIGIREAVFIDPVEELPGRGLEKLAGEGLCGRDSAGVGDAASFLVESVKPINRSVELVTGVVRLLLDILLRCEWLCVRKSTFGRASVELRWLSSLALTGLEASLTLMDDLWLTWIGVLLSVALVYEDAGDCEMRPLTLCRPLAIPVIVVGSSVAGAIVDDGVVHVEAVESPTP